MRQRTPIWPYILVLGCLFALALIAPRGWDHFAQDDAAKQATISETPSPSDGITAESAAVVLPAQVQPAGFMTPTDTGPTMPNTARLPASATDQAGNAADQVGDRWQLDAAAELKGGDGNSQEPVRLTPEATKTPDAASAPAVATPALAAAQPAPPAATSQPTTPVLEIPAPAVLELHRDVTAAGERLATEFSRTLRAFAIHPKPKAPLASPVPVNPRPLPDNPAIGTATATDLPPVAADAPPPPHAWPLPQSLLDALHALTKQDDAAVRGWVADVDGQIEHLNRLQPQDVLQAATVLKEIRNLVEQGAALAAHASSMESASEIRRVQYAIVRRLDVWDAVCDERQATIASMPQPTSNRRRMELCLADVNTMAEKNGAATGLREHLMLDTLAELAKRDDEAAADQRRRVAREVLGRIAEHRQAAGHPTLIEERSLAKLDKQLRRWAAAPVEAGPPEGEELLALLERFEANGRADDARRLAEFHDELSRSAVPADNELGRRLESHYRNANLRIVLSAQLINRLLPEQKTMEAPVNDTILGTPIRGRSTTSTQLNVRLLPNQRTWQLTLEAAGSVDSQTSSTYGPVTFMNQGAAQYCVRKRILVDAAGIHAEPATAAADSNSSVAGIRTDFDSIPLVRSIVRNYALSQREHKEAEANQEAEAKIRQTACSRVDSQIEPRLAQVEQNFRDRLLAPLEKLELKPAIETLETTDTRLTVRSRLAGGDQLAAHTPRPEAPSDSLASMQMNESAVNNLLDHLDLAGRTFTLPELHRHLNEKLSNAGKPLPQDLPEGVEVTFAKTEPLRIQCEQGRIELVLNIAEIRQGKRRWHDFEVRAGYRPEARGLSADFQRDGSIELGGQYKGKTEVALRGIFSKVLSRERKISLLPSAVADDPRMANLQVTQLVVEDGWIGLAIGPTTTVARQPPSVKRL